MNHSPFVAATGEFCTPTLLHSFNILNTVSSTHRNPGSGPDAIRLYHKTLQGNNNFPWSLLPLQSLRIVAPIQLPGRDWVVTFILTWWSWGSLSPAHPISSLGSCQPLQPTQTKPSLTFRSSLTTSGYANFATSGNVWHDECSCQTRNAIRAQSEMDGDRKWWWRVSMITSQKTMRCDGLTDKQKGVK